MKAEKDKPTISKLKTLCTLIQNDPSNKQLHRVFAGLLKKINPEEHSFFSSFQPGLYNALEILFLRDRVNHYQLATFASRQLSLKYQINANIFPSQPKELLHRLRQDGLFLTYLEKSVNVDYDFEVFLVKLRRFLLWEYRSRHRLDRGYFRLTAALAQQCFNNEYIFNDETDELEVLNEIQEKLANVFSIDDVRTKEVHLLVLSMYRPPFRLPTAAQIAQIPLHVFSGPIRSCIERMLYEPLEELKMKQEIPSFGTIICQTSKVVRNQYEENPYPRWFNIERGVEPLEVKLTKRFPGFKFPLQEQGTFLIFGCKNLFTKDS